MKGFTCSINRSWKLKFLVVLLIICGLCYGKKIHKCFTGANNLVQVEAHCPHSTISLDKMVFSIPKLKKDLCNPDCYYLVSNGKRKRCDCCTHKMYSQKCTVDSRTDAQWNASCETRQHCNTSISKIDLSDHCGSQVNYTCSSTNCMSKWLNITYKCVQGMKLKLLV